MSDYDPIIDEYTAGGVVRMSMLVEMNFRSETRRIWPGPYDIESDGRTWQGISRIIKMEGLEQASTAEASEITLTLSGVDSDLMQIAAREDSGEYVQRLAVLYLQFFDENFQVVGEPLALFAGFMSLMAASKVVSDRDGFVMSLSLTIMNMFYGRSSPPFAFWSDADQQKRHTGDVGLNQIVALQDVSIPVPWR